MDPDTGRHLAATLQDLATLQSEHVRYRSRYRLPPAPIEPLERKIADRRRRVEHLRAQIAEMQTEVAILETETSGYAKGIIALLEDAIDRARVDHDEGWSPTPVLGYRLWSIDRRGLVGFRVRWESPRLAARCETLGREPGGDEDIPHTGGECGVPPCGIYAAKSLDALLGAHPEATGGDIAVGLVALTGKVVEHEYGYRAAEAEVIALGMQAGGRLLLVDAAETVAGAFARPVSALASAVPADGHSLSTIATFLVARHEELDPWISARRSG